MISSSLKEAIKVSLSVGISIALALFFQWDKPYWAAIAVIAISANETFGHGIQKGKLRIFGTIAGILCALLIIGLFPQDRLLFIGSFHLVLGVCVFFGDSKKYGYAFTMAFGVFCIVALMGGASGEASFNVAILRIQETMLGVLVYSAVYRFLWPTTTESLFFDALDTVTKQFNLARSTLEPALACKHKIDPELDLFDSQHQINKLHELLTLPMKSNYQFRHEKVKWQTIVAACDVIQVHITRLVNDIDNQVEQHVIDNSFAQLNYIMTLYAAAFSNDGSQVQMLAQYCAKVTVTKTLVTDKEFNDNLLSSRLNNAFTAIAISLTCFGLWIYFAIPGGPIFPLVGAALAGVTVQMPETIIRQAIMASLAWGAVFIAEYCFVLTLITELWQLVGFYMINMLLIYGFCGKPSLSVQRLLGGNLLLIMTMNALHATPKFEIVTPLLMLVIMLICLSITRFYKRLIHN